MDFVPVVEDCPRYESHWMSAELLSLSADYIDTLLEDWYPGLGAREGGKTMDSVPYVNRVIPCPYCINNSTLLEEETSQVKMVAQECRGCASLLTILLFFPLPLFSLSPFISRLQLSHQKNRCRLAHPPPNRSMCSNCPRRPGILPLPPLSPALPQAPRQSELSSPRNGKEAHLQERRKGSYLTKMALMRTLSHSRLNQTGGWAVCWNCRASLVCFN